MRFSVRILILVIVMISLLFPASAVKSETEEKVELWFFGAHGCENCKAADAWLQELNAIYPEIVIHRQEVWYNMEERERFIKMMEERDMVAYVLPTIILDELVWEGFNEFYAKSIIWEVEQRIAALSLSSDHAGQISLDQGLNLGPLGSINIVAQPLLTATLLIAFVDGFNPCSLWVLTVLMAIILNTRSRARIAIVGAVFLLVTASIYGMFIAGLFTALTLIDHLTWIRWVIALLALGMAVINIKDWFVFKQGPSLTIPDRFKPAIYRGGREVARDRPLPVVLAITVCFAAGVALIELPCTAGFPVIWTGMLNEAGVVAGRFVMLLLAYLAVYLAIEIAIITTAVVTMRATRLQEVHGRTLKLIGGMVMAAIAFVLLLAPSMMEQFTGSLLVIGGALAASGLVMLITRLWPKSV